MSPSAAGPVAAPVEWAPGDQAAMLQARTLARLGAGRTWTNPMVGAVVMAGAEVVGSAYHHRLGQAHAETLALQAAGNRTRGATLYVSLEPCAHTGHTPPCVDSVISAGIERVVMPVPDPDVRVCGRGIARLRAHGVTVDVGCHAAPAILDNHAYYHDRLGLGSTVTLKMAASRDGMVARSPGRRDRITGDAAQMDVHRLRAVHDAVIIGAGTARVDRPRLDCRLLPEGVDREPVVVVFDTTASLAGDANWPASGREFVVMVGSSADAARVRAIESRGGRVLRCTLDGAHVSVQDALDRLAGIGLNRILVEGGPRLFSSFVAADAWDAFWYYEAGAEFGPGGLPMMSPDARDLLSASAGQAVDEVSLGSDVRRRYARVSSWRRLNERLAARVVPGKD